MEMESVGRQVEKVKLDAEIAELGEDSYRAMVEVRAEHGGIPRVHEFFLDSEEEAQEYILEKVEKYMKGVKVNGLLRVAEEVDLPEVKE